MFAERLKQARKAKKLSQAEVSRQLGVTQQAVGKWEAGRSTPDPQTVARLAEMLDTTADALLGLHDGGAPVQAFSRMEPRMSDGDLALVHRQPTLENGELGVLIFGTEGEGTLKKYIRRGNAVVLHPFNPAYEDMVLKGEELDHLYIAGKVVETKARR